MHKVETAVHKAEKSEDSQAIEERKAVIVERKQEIAERNRVIQAKQKVRKRVIVVIQATAKNPTPPIPLSVKSAQHFANYPNISVITLPDFLRYRSIIY